MLRRRYCLNLFSLLFIIGNLSQVARADYTTTVDPGTHWGKWQGWGCSLAWWANQFGQRSDLADTLFTTGSHRLTTNTGTYSLPGLGLTAARYNVGGTSRQPIAVSGKIYTPNNPTSLPAFKSIQNYWLDWNSADPSSHSWDWSRDANQRNMMRLAKARGANFFEMFSDSPPWWMCYNASTAGGTNGGDNLQSWNYQQFALYLATVARYAHDHWGITFESVEPFNEPISNWWHYPGSQEGCHFDESTQNAILPYLRTALNDQGLGSMPIAASDENTYDGALNTWNSLNIQSQSAVSQINTHGYEGGNGRRDLLYAAANDAHKVLWNSEYGEGDTTGLQLASNLNLDMRWLHPTVWCYWQPFDSGGWGLIQSNPGDNWIGSPNPKYYVLAQYTRAIRPGMMLIDGGDGSTIAAYDAKSHRLALVTTNYGTAQWISYDLSRFKGAAGNTGGKIDRWVTQTGGGDQYTYHNDTVLSGKKFKSWFAPNTVQTFIINHVTL